MDKLTIQNVSILDNGKIGTEGGQALFNFDEIKN